MQAYTLSRNTKLMAVAAVAILFVTGCLVLFPGSDADSSKANTSDTAYQTVVRYTTDTPSGIRTNYNDTTTPSDRDVTYSGNVISTEYNPQVWDYGTKWYSINSYSKNNTVVFTGWQYRIGEDTYTTSTFDPGDVLHYVDGRWYFCESRNGYWYTGTDGTELYTTDAEGNPIVTEDGENNVSVSSEKVQYIYVKATWGKITQVQTNDRSDRNVTTYTTGSPYTQFHLISNSLNLNANLLSNATIRAAPGSNVTITVGSFAMTGDAILDSGTYNFYCSGGNHMDSHKGLYANGHLLIIGDGIRNVVSNDSEGNLGYRLGNVAGGSSNGTSLASTKVIIHGGMYATVVAGSTQGTVSKDCVLIMNGGQVTDTLMGAGSGGKCNGDAYIYATGLRMYGDYYEEDMLDDGVLNGSFDEIQDVNGKIIKPYESSIFTGGGSGTSNSNRNSYIQNTYVFLSGDSSVWDLQASGRRDGASVDNSANVEVSGEAVIKHVLCGSITDGIRNGGNKQCVKTVNLIVRGDAKVASVFGAGFDTFYAATYASMYGTGSSINVGIHGGTVGYVYGGGYRGTVGTETSPLDSVNILIDGGTILGDVFGGGRGGVDKMCHYPNGHGQWSESRGDVTGYSKVYAKTVNVTITGGAVVKGDVYGGGESIPGVARYNLHYGNSDTFLTPNLATGVASLFADEVNVNVDGAIIEGSVYGGGKGIDASKNYLPDIICIWERNGAVETFRIPWISDNTAVNYFDFSKLDTYLGYAKVTADVNVTIGAEGGELTATRIAGSVYGGGALGVVEGTTDVKMLSGTVEDSLYGGGLGRSGVVSVQGDTNLTLIGGLVKKDVFGGSAYGIVSGNLYTTILNGTVGGSVYGGGLGRSGIFSTHGKRTVYVNGGKIGGSIYGSSSLGEDGTVSYSNSSSYYVGSAERNGNRTGDKVDVYIPYGLSYPFTKFAISNVGTNITGQDVTLEIIACDKNNKELGVCKTLALKGIWYNPGNDTRTNYYSVITDSMVIDADFYSMEFGGKALKEYAYGYYFKAVAKVNGTQYGGYIKLIPRECTFGQNSDSTVVISEGEIGNAVFGGGFMGNTYGSTNVYIGYTTNGTGTPQPNSGNGDAPVIDIAGSVYAGGDVKESDSPFTLSLVHGDGSVYVNGSHADISIPGSIMGSGNSCLTEGETKVELWYFDDPKEMFGVHRADTVLLYASVLDISGMYSAVGDMQKMCSLSHIGELTMQAGSSIFIDNPIEDVAKYNSFTRSGTPTTTSAPFNKIVFTAGSTLFIRANDGVDIAYGTVTGYTILSVADNAPFGGYVLGDAESSTGGFVILREGSYVIADYSDYSGKVRCWFISGVESKVLTLSLPYGTGTQKVNGSVDIIKLQDTSNLVYTGGTFIPYNDGYSFGRPGLCSGTEFGLMLGYMWGDSNNTLVSDKQHYVGMTPALTSWKYSTYFKGDESSVDESMYCTEDYDHSDPAKDGTLNPVVLRTGTVSGSSSASPTKMDAIFTPDSVGRAGTFSLNLQFCGTPEDMTDYLGYVILYIQEVNTITIVDSEGEHTENMVSNRIDLRVDLYTIGSTLARENELTINTVDGEGSATFLFNTGRLNQSVCLLSSECSNDASGVELAVEGVKNVGNSTGWKTTATSFTVTDFNNEGEPDTSNLMEIGTLNGGYMGTVKFSVSGFDPKYNGMNFTVVLVLKDGDGNFIMTAGGDILTVTLIITLKERNKVTVTFYDYTQGVTAQTGGLPYSFSYGTVLTEAQCPPVLENFIGWYQDETFVNVYNFNTPLVRDISLYARYTYTVTFDYQNGTTSKIYVASSNTGVRISAPPAPSMPGYTFDGWYKQSTCIEEWDFTSDRVSGNTVLYAKWVGDNIRIIFTYGENQFLDYRITAEGSTLVNRNLPTGTLTGPFVRYGESFNILDIHYSSSVGEDVCILDGARIMLLEILDSGERFIKWNATTVNGKTVAIYSDTILDDTLIDLEHPAEEDGMKVIYLTALTSKIAVNVVMEAVTDLDALIVKDPSLEALRGRVNETDLSATVTAPSTFLIYPEDGEDTAPVYTFKFVLNDATRSGWTLYGWHNTHVTSGISTYPAAGLVREIRLTTEMSGDKQYVMKEELYKDGTWYKLITYEEGHHEADNRLDDPSNPYTIRYIALWEQIEYTVTVSNTAHGIVDAYYIDTQGNKQIPGTTFTVHYGDRIKLVFTPEDRYDFYRWTYAGECLIEDVTSPSTTLVVTGDAIIYASDTGARVVRLYATFDGSDATAQDKMYLRDSVSGEYEELPRIASSDKTGYALYRAYIVPGTYYVCIKEGDTDYVFGTAVVGTGETTYTYTIYSVMLDIKDDEDNAVGIGNGITAYTKYIGKETGSSEDLYGSITVSKGYTYALTQGYVDGGYERANDLGNNTVGVTSDTQLNYRLSATVDRMRVIWGTISPITLTVTFVLGNQPGDRTWIDGSDDISITSTPVSIKVKYGESFADKLPSAADIGFTDNGTGAIGNISQRNYAIYNWYLRHAEGSFAGVVYESTVIDAAFMSQFIVGELNNNSFSLYSWIIKNVDEITITCTISMQNANAATAQGTPGYTTSEVQDVTFISLSADTYTGVFALPVFEGFKTYLEMGYIDSDHLGDWMTIVPIYAEGKSGTFTKSIIVTDTDVVASFVFTGDKPSLELDMKYDRMVARICIDSGEYGAPDEASINFLGDRGWVTEDGGKTYYRDARYEETIYAPWMILKDAYKDYYTHDGWVNDGGAGFINDGIVNPYSGRTTFSYKVTLDDVNAYKADKEKHITFVAVYKAISTYALTMITPVGRFSNGLQRYTVYLTPAQVTTPYVEIPKDDSGYYYWIGWNTPALLNLTHDQTIVGTWGVKKHTLTYSVDPKSEGRISISATYDKFAAKSGAEYNHHSEIILTILPAAGYTLDVLKTKENSNIAGDPVFVSDDRGFRWEFFLDAPAEIVVYATKATIPVHFLVNGSIVETRYFEKYGFCYFEPYSHPGYTSTSAWYTDSACNKEYTKVIEEGENEGKYYIQVISETAFYTTATPNTYFIVYHPNNGSETEAFDTDVSDSIADHLNNGTELPAYIQKITYGSGFRLNDYNYTWDNSLREGWSLYSDGSVMDGRVFHGRITHLLRQDITEDFTLRNYNSKLGLYDPANGVVHMYAYYVGLEIDSAVYDGEAHSGLVVKKTNTEDGQNLTVYYSASILNSTNYSTVGSTSPVGFIDAGDHIAFYYGWVNVHENDDLRCVFQGTFTVTISKRPVTFTSESPQRGYIAGTPLPGGKVTWGKGEIVAGQEKGLTFTLTYVNAKPVAGSAPINEGEYINSFTVEFDEVRIKSTNYTWTIIPGTITITKSADNITIERVVNITYGDTGYVMNWTDESVIGRESVTYVSANTDIVKVDTTGGLTVLAAGTTSIKVALKSDATAFVDVQVIVAQKPIDFTVTLSNVIKKYDGTDRLAATPALSADSSDILSGDVVTYSVSGRYTGTHASASVPLEFTITLGGEKGSNYTTGTVSAPSAGEITVRELILTTESASKVFDNTPLTAGYTLTGDGFVSGQGFSTVSVTGTITNVGTTSNTLGGYTFNSNTTVAGDYHVTTVLGTLEITVRTVTVPTGGSHTYNGETIAAAVAFSDYYVLSGDISGKDIGSYTVNADLKYNTAVTNVRWSDGTSETKVITWTIVAAQLDWADFRLLTENRYYNGIEYEPELVCTKYELGVDYSIRYVNNINATVSADSTFVEVTGMGGYEGSNHTYSFVILPKTVDVTVSLDQSYVYNGTGQSIRYNVPQDGSASGFIVGHEETVSVTNSSNKDVGTYVSVFTITGGTPTNYRLYLDGETPVPVTWKITPRPILIIADSQWKAYNGTELTANGYSSFGILPEEKEHFTITVTGSQTDIGYSINKVECEIDNTLSAGNYDIRCVSGTLMVINPVSATVTSGSASTLGAPAVMAAVSPGRRWVL